MSGLLQGESVPCEEEQENNCGAKQQKNQSLKERWTSLIFRERNGLVSTVFMHNHSQENLQIHLCLEVVGKICPIHFHGNQKNIWISDSGHFSEQTLHRSHSTSRKVLQDEKASQLEGLAEPIVCLQHQQPKAVLLAKWSSCKET